MKKRILSGLAAILIISAGYLYHEKTLDVSAASNVKYDKVIYLPSNRYPETAKHIRSAIKKGKSEICTIDRVDEQIHRKQSLRGIPTKKGYDRDEFPMAMCKEGGTGADIMYISPKDNRGAGSWVSHQVHDWLDGTRVLIKVQ